MCVLVTAAAKYNQGDALCVHIAGLRDVLRSECQRMVGSSL